MRKILVFILAFGVLTSLVYAQNPAKLQAYIASLEDKLEVAQAQGNQNRADALSSLLADAKSTLKEHKAKSAKAIKPAEPAVQAEEIIAEDDKLAEMKEEMNGALKDLKVQVDKVKSDNSDAKVGAQIFFQWQNYNMGGSATKVANFDVTRAYLDFKKKLDGEASGRVTLDVARITGAARQNLFDYLKYAYVEMPVNTYLTAKLGLQHTVWIDWADKMLGLRFIAKSLLDNEGVMSSADFGLGALGKFIVGSLPEIEYMTTVLNGTGYATNETDSNKAVAVRLNSTLYSNDNLGKVILGAWGNVDSLGFDLNTSASTKQAGLGLGYQHDLGRVFAEYLKGSKSSKSINGYSLGGVLNIGGIYPVLNGCNLFARNDNYCPDTSNTTGSNIVKRTYYGITYDWTKDLKLALDMQNSQTGGGAVTSILSFNTSIQM